MVRVWRCLRVTRAEGLGPGPRVWEEPPFPFKSALLNFQAHCYTCYKSSQRH
uniref:Uncharacterized protein n=1 Tax=Anguilla anguilla TaxID=7936 RepID=A0A0E9VXY4_ANGAN